MSTSWRDSDASEDDGNHNILSVRKRSSRACDQCRKSKSKCERPSEDSSNCSSCILARTNCTYIGPSYKRGPPKGYIHAIEQRWHQVESLLGAIIACPNQYVQEIVTGLQEDDLASDIIARVNKGPFGPLGRLNQPAGATKEDVLASIFRSNDTSPVRDAARSRRQSRLSREIVSSLQDNLVMPTTEWQDSLSRRLAVSIESSLVSLNPSWDTLPERSVTTASSSVISLEMFETSAPGNRQNNKSENGLVLESALDELYSLDTESDGFEATSDDADAPGQLSFDENGEVHYHGEASGVHVLGLPDSVQNRWPGSVPWTNAPIWSPRISRSLFNQDGDMWPSIAVQGHLIRLYLDCFHPTFPVIHESQLMPECGKSEKRSPMSSIPRNSFRNIPDLLLLSVFAIAERYSEGESRSSPRDSGCKYAEKALIILRETFQISRISTVQALLLLGHREFGIGSMQQAWAYIGMAIRMAIDLGLNHNSEPWQTNGTSMFTHQENQERRRVWWACCVTDKYVSACLGRPVSIFEDVYDTPMNGTENKPGLSFSLEIGGLTVPAGRILNVFLAAASLSVIVGRILKDMYPVRNTARGSQRVVLANLEGQLDRWYSDLPDDLQFDTSSKQSVPPPNVLHLHVQYWNAVILLHSVCIRNPKTHISGHKLPRDIETASLRAFDICQTAASCVSSTVTTCFANFGPRSTSPFLPSFVLSAGIVHVLTLRLRPSSVQASLGLRQCMAALKAMDTTWPNARPTLTWLDNNVNAGLEVGGTPVLEESDGTSDDSVVVESPTDYVHSHTIADYGCDESMHMHTDADTTTRMMAHMLGLEIPEGLPSTSYNPEHEWWSNVKHELSSSSLSPMHNFSTSQTDSPFSTQDTGSWLHDHSRSNPEYSFDLPPNDFGI